MFPRLLTISIVVLVSMLDLMYKSTLFILITGGRGCSNVSHQQNLHAPLPHLTIFHIFTNKDIICLVPNNGPSSEKQKL
jgi:hypothetical protein